MDPDTSYRSITCRLRQHKRRRQRDATTGVGVFEATGGYNSSFDVSQLVPERPVPDWIRHRVKASAPVHKSAALQRYEKKGGEARKRDSSTNDGMTLDLKNMRKDWKSRSTRRVEALQAARVLQNRRPEPVRDFPRDIRPLKIPSDSPVAVYAGANAGNTRKRFGSPAAYEETDVGLELGFNEIGKREMLMEKTYLVLDQSKLPLEVSYVRCTSMSIGVRSHSFCLALPIIRLSATDVYVLRRFLDQVIQFDYCPLPKICPFSDF